MAQDPKSKREKTPDLSLVDPSTSQQRQDVPLGTSASPPGPPPLPASAKVAGLTTSAAAVRIEEESDPTSAQPPAPAEVKIEKPATPPPLPEASTKESEPEARKATLPPPPPLPTGQTETSKVVRPLRLSELQRKPDPAPADKKEAAIEGKKAKAPGKPKPEEAASAPESAQAKPDTDFKPSEPRKDSDAEFREFAADTIERRAARRRPAGPSRARIAANDDAPSIGGLIYALNERPSNKPFIIAAAASGVWAAISIAFAWAFITRELGDATGFFDAIGRPATLMAFATVAGPIALFWFLALLVWRSEDLRLRSTAMTEVAVRLAEPDRMAEQSVASLGQAVRRQVSFMNDAVSRALGRAGELEALVHNEVTALERSYEDNERRIRNLIQELSGERNALLNTTERVNEALKSIASEVPELIEKLSAQQLKLATIIEGAGQNLTALESALAQQTKRLEHTLGTRTQDMQAVLQDFTAALGTALNARTEQMQALFDEYRQSIEKSLEGRAESLQNVFEEYAKALDKTLANRAQALDIQLVERTAALDEAFEKRLKLFDESILRSTMAIDNAIGEKAQALTAALEKHARSLNETLNQQAIELDENLMQGIAAVRRTSENITRQSIKAIEGLSHQSEMLKSISENLLAQIHSVTNRFESQGQSIMMAANALESANYKIDATLQSRQEQLNETLERLASKAQEMSQLMYGASTTVENSLAQAEQRARQLAQELTKGAEARSRSALAEIERMKIAANVEADRAFEELTARFARVSRQVTEQLAQLQSQFNATSAEVRLHAQRTASELAAEQERLRKQIEALPHVSRETSEAMRKSLADQIRALEDLSALTAREAARRDVVPPSEPIPGGVLTPLPSASERRQNSLSSLTSSLAHELSQRQRKSGGGSSFADSPSGEPGNSREGWSLGDLLARASRDDDNAGRRHQPPPAVRASPPNIDVGLLSRVLDEATASMIWSRFRAGQRGIMVRSIYSAEGRAAFDEVSRHYRNDPSFRHMVDDFLDEFENSLRRLEHEPDGKRRLANHLVSEHGRAYLFLAHASGRLS